MIFTLLIPWLPTATVLLGVVCQEVALPFEAWSVLRPDLALICLFYWRLYRADLCGPILAFSTGLMIDLLAGTPLGLNGFAKVVTLLIVGYLGVRLRAAEFVYHLPVVAVLVVLEQGMQWLFFSAIRESAFYAPLLVGRPLATVLMTPVVVFVLIHIHKSWLELR